jgi:hypothetical protein
MDHLMDKYGIPKWKEWAEGNLNFWPNESEPPKMVYSGGGRSSLHGSGPKKRNGELNGIEIDGFWIDEA